MASVSSSHNRFLKSCGRCAANILSAGRRGHPDEDRLWKTVQAPCEHVWTPQSREGKDHGPATSIKMSRACGKGCHALLVTCSREGPSFAIVSCEDTWVGETVLITQQYQVTK